MTNNLVDGPLFEQFGECLRLLGPWEFAQGYGFVDGQCAVRKGRQQTRVGISKDKFHIADIASARSGYCGYLTAYIEVLRIWQFCQTLVSAALTHVGDCSALEMGFELEGEADPHECVPPALWPVVYQAELERFLLSECVFDTLDFLFSVQQC